MCECLLKCAGARVSVRPWLAVGRRAVGILSAQSVDRFAPARADKGCQCTEGLWELALEEEAEMQL